jgi:hypothetical protein
VREVFPGPLLAWPPKEGVDVERARGSEAGGCRRARGAGGVDATDGRAREGRDGTVAGRARLVARHFN